MKMDIIALDMDGTLLNPEGKINPEVYEAVQKAKDAGIKVVLCTGRPLPGVTPYLEQLGLTREGDFVITYNGALVQRSHNGSIIAHHTMDHDDFMTVSEIADKAGIHFQAINDHGVYTPNKNISYYTVRESFLSNVPLRYRSTEEMDPDMTYSKMMMIDPPEILEAGMERLPKDMGDHYTLLRSEPFFLEVLNKNASKGAALKDVADILGVPRERVMAVGDNENDIAMIAYAGVGVAMENAVDKVKEVSDRITLSNAENGVAQAIYDYAL